MKKFNPTDDQLLSYLIGDLEKETQIQIENWLEEDSQNQSRLNIIRFLRNEIKNTPIVYKKKTMAELWPVLLMRFGALCVAFVAGLFIQANMDLLTLEKSNVESTPTKLSEPMSWENYTQKNIL